MARRTWYVVVFTLACIAAAVLVPAIPQPAAYHRFADTRSMLGIANFLDVASNIAFLIAGLAGLVLVMRPGTVFASGRERWPYAVFFAGIFALGGLVSGHSLKHLAAAASGFVVCWMLSSRRLVQVAQDRALAEARVLAKPI